MKKIENLWPTDINTATMTMPKEILIQQASYLAEMTKNVLIGEVKTISGVTNNEKVIVHEFNVKAPTMGNYQFNLIRVQHDFNIYPILLVDNLTGQHFNANTEGEFKHNLNQIFSSATTRNAINAVVGQAI